jgi:hypothetical protein
MCNLVAQISTEKAGSPRAKVVVLRRSRLVLRNDLDCFDYDGQDDSGNEAVDKAVPHPIVVRLDCCSTNECRCKHGAPPVHILRVVSSLLWIGFRLLGWRSRWFSRLQITGWLSSHNLELHISAFAVVFRFADLHVTPLNLRLE